MKIKQYKMENSIMATISVLHIFLGFTSGMAFASMLHFADTYKMQKALEKAKDEKFKQDLLVDELNERIEELEERTGELEDTVCRAARVLSSSLPAPSRNEDGCLERETQCICDDVEFTLECNMVQTPK